MKLLIFSDSHRSTSGMIEAIETHHPDHIIHLGDLMSDAEELTYIYPKLPITFVPGNCDGWTAEPAKKQITLAGQSILLSHGHLWLVKDTYSHAIREARSVHANILLFGHTHRAYCETLEDGLVVMNPGAANRHYGIILLQDGSISPSLHSIS